MADKRARIIDANLNRLTEGLKVVEDVLRFGMEDVSLVSRVRAVREEIGGVCRGLRRRVLASRESENDLGRTDEFDRMRRRSLEDVLLANFKRAEEAARVLEEVLKLDQPRLAARFKAVRFRLYDLEKEAVAQAGGKVGRAASRKRS